MSPWAQGIMNKIGLCTEEEGYLPLWRKSEAQTQTLEWPGARPYAGGIPQGARKSAPTPVVTLSSVDEKGNDVDMSGRMLGGMLGVKVWTREPRGVQMSRG